VKLKAGRREGRQEFMAGDRSTRLKDVGVDRLECSKKCAKKCEEKTPRCEIVVAVGASEIDQFDCSSVSKKRATHASATPMMTGMSDNIFDKLHDTPNNDADSKIVKIGVEARTTWWNWGGSI